MIRNVFLETAAGMTQLATHHEVSRRWNEPSVLAEMTVGALAGHLVRAITTADRYLDTIRPPRPGEEALDAAGYLLSIDDLSGPDGPDLDTDLHRSIRARAAEEASVGPTGLAARWERTLARLADRLPSVTPDARISVLGGRVISVDDYLVSRIIELVVHGDDLALSLDTALPAIPVDAWWQTITTLVTVARRRHGELAVVRALTRVERDTVAALRVL